MIHISYGRSGGDCTSQYYVTISKPMTVGEFIDEFMKKNPGEWGVFIVKTGPDYFDRVEYEYRYGKLLSSPDKELFDRKIKDVTGGGGWSNSDFRFELEDE